MMNKDMKSITVEDVYDLASELGKDFERIIDSFGPEAVESLMPKVIRVLEHLELICTGHDDLDTEVDSLKTKVIRLEKEKQQKAQNKIKFEDELEEIEENWKKEHVELSNMVGKLKEENLKLATSLHEKSSLLSQLAIIPEANGQC